MNLDVSTSSPAGVLTLLALHGVGPQATERLRGRFATLQAIVEASPKDLEVVSASVRTSLRDQEAWKSAYLRALSILTEAERQGVRVLTVADDDYPVLLREIRDRPPVLYVRGQLRRDRRAVACIGTRTPSRFGEEVTKRITSALAERGWSIVSGLAVGVDSLAHQAALEKGAHTVAVLANGLDAVYPKKNTQLANDILNAGGAWISEQPCGVPATPRNLVQRDRIQSAMSVATVVMQTGVVGGSMHTVRFTLMQGRLLVAPVPQGRFAQEMESGGILAVTTRPGIELRGVIDADGEYAALLGGQFRDRPVAMPIKGREDYEHVFSVLERLAIDETSDAHGPHPAPF